MHKTNVFGMKKEMVAFTNFLTILTIQFMVSMMVLIQ